MLLDYTGVSEVTWFGAEESVLDIQQEVAWELPLYVKVPLHGVRRCIAAIEEADILPEQRCLTESASGRMDEGLTGLRWA